ncbi:hypothetical protein GJ496_003866 [Pomphorhynchus laevis]|nr:hypothetical protein GJ496_003866 [Pomphorhynchus laevis]
MNPLTQIRNQNKINELEIKLNSTLGSKSWHHKYIGSAWVYIGGLSYELNEGDVICVFSQYGEVVNINLIRDKKTGKSKGFAFLCYADQRSTILAVDNFNGIKLCGRIIRVDHIEKYRPPEDFEDDDEIIRVLKNKGCGPDVDFNLIQTTKETDAKKERCNTPSKDVRQSTLKETHSSKLNNKYNRRSNATDKEQSRCNIAKWIESTKPRDGTPRMSDQKDKREMLFRNKHRSISPTP